MTDSTIQTMDAVSAAQDEYDRHARQLAIGLMIQHKLDTDPYFPADRSARSNRGPAQMQAEALAAFIAANAALNAAWDAHLTSKS